MIQGNKPPTGCLDVPPYMIATTLAVYTSVILSHLQRGPVQRSGLREVYNRLCDAWQSMMKLDALTDLVVDVPPVVVEEVPDRGKGKKNVKVDESEKLE